MKRKTLRKMVAFGLLVCMSATLMSCDDGKNGKEGETTKTEQTGRTENTEGAKTPSRCFGNEERSIWYYIKTETEDEVKQSVDEDAVIDTIYVFENGNVITYDLDYEEFALDNKLGDLEQMSDDAIIEWLDENNQSEALRLQATKDSELAVGEDVKEQGTLEVLEEYYEDGELMRLDKYSVSRDQYDAYIFYLKKFDPSLYNNGSYSLNVITDEKLNTSVKEELKFGYVDAMTVPQFTGLIFEYDKDGKVVAIEDERTVMIEGNRAGGVSQPNASYSTTRDECIQSEPAVGKEYTFVGIKGVTEIGNSYYGGFDVENLYNYGVTVENGWFVTRTEENAKFELDAVGTEGVDIDGLTKNEK